MLALTTAMHTNENALHRHDGDAPDNAVHDRPATYAIGDLHGEITLLRHLLDRLSLQPDKHLIFLGDYMDRGEDSVATVLFLIDLATKQPCVFLRGNHDEEWLEWWNGKRFTRLPAIPGARKVWEQHPRTVPLPLGEQLLGTL